MANAIYLYLNYFDQAELAASGEVTPVSRLKEMRPGRTWISPQIADAGQDKAFVEATWPGSVKLTHCAVIGHSLGGLGRIRCRLFSNPDLTGQIYDSGEQTSYFSEAGFGFDEFGLNLGDLPNQGNQDSFRAFFLFDLGSPQIVRSARFEFVDPEASLIEVGRIFAGEGFQPRWNFAKDWQLTTVDPSEVNEAEAGVLTVRRRVYRQMTLNQPHLERNEALFSFSDLSRELGRSKDLLVVPFPDAASDEQARTSIYGVLRQEAGVTRTAALQEFSSSLTIRELVP